MKSIINRILKAIKWTIGMAALLLLTILLALQLEVVQTQIAKRVVHYISVKTQSPITLNRIHFSLINGLVLEGLYAADSKQDTLASIGELALSFSTWKALSGEMVVNEVRLTDATINLKRNAADGFNFDFLLKAFASSPKSSADTFANKQSSIPPIELDELILASVTFNYLDSVSGVFSHNKIERVALEAAQLDLNQLAFVVSSIELTGVTSTLKLITTTQPSAKQESLNSTSNRLPTFKVGVIYANQLKFDLVMPDTTDKLFVSLGSGLLKPRIIDLNKNHIAIQEAWFNNCSTSIAMVSPSKPSDNDTSKTTEWFVDVMKLRIGQTTIGLDLNQNEPLPNAVDYNHLLVSNLNVTATDLHYHGVEVSGQLKQLNFTERSGFEVKQAHTQFAYTGKEATLSGLLLQTKHSVIANYAHINGLANLAKDLSELNWQLSFSKSKIGMQDVLMLVPQLKQDVWLAKNQSQTITLDGAINGNMEHLEIAKLVATTASQTALAIVGEIECPFDLAKSKASITVQSFTSTLTDIVSLVPAQYLPSTIVFPKQFQLRGQLNGGMQDAGLSAVVNSTDGGMDLAASLKTEGNTPNVHINFTLDKWAVGRTVKVNEIGLVTATIEATYKGSAWQQSTADIEVAIPLLDYLGHRYNAIALNGNLDNGNIALNITTADTALKASLNAKIDATKQPYSCQLKGAIQDADLAMMQLSKAPLHLSTEASFSLIATQWDDAQANLKLQQLVLAQPNHLYKTEEINGKLFNSKTKHEFSLVSDWFNINYEGNIDVVDLPKVAEAWSQWVHQSSTLPNQSRKQQLDISIQVRNHPMISGLLMPSIKQFNGLELELKQQQQLSDMVLTFKMPLLVMDELQLYGTAFDVKPALPSKAVYTCTFDSVLNGVVWLPHTNINGEITQGLVRTNLSIAQPDSGYRLKLGAIIECSPTAYQVKFTPDSITVMNSNWFVNPNHELKITNGLLNASQLKLSNGEESIMVQSATASHDAPLRIGFEKVSLDHFSKIIERNQSLVKGNLSGEVLLIDTRTFSFTADVSLQNLAYRNYLIGNLELEAANTGGADYSIKAVLSGNGNQALVSGKYNNTEVDMSVEVESFTMQALESFVPNYIRNSSGFITSTLTVKGSLDKPIVKGDIQFKEASFILAAINNRLHLNNEMVQFDQNGLYFKQFSIRDSMNQPLQVKGTIYFENSTQQRYELDVSTRNFRVLNTTAKNNKLYYGSILLNSDIQIRGNTALPKVDAKVSLLEGTNMTVVVQQGELSTDKGDGVVVFRRDSLPFGVVPIDSGKYSSLREIEVHANIEINKATVFNIITDQESGDNLSVSGAGAIGFAIDRSGKMSLVGVYSLSQGKYKASFQKIVKREFDIKEGSTISWTGDVLNAEIAITATYRTKAGATDLLAQELAGFPPEERNVYRRLLTYDVNLVMKGLLLNPELNFKLDMPIAKEQNEFNGLPYAKINQVNNDPNELNKQVFSLLILDRFLPVGQSVSPSASEAVTSVARNSVNQLLSDQLNRYSDKWIKGAELNFDLQSVDDYSSAKGTGQTTTELQVGIKKQLFNNKMSVQVGSSINMDANAQNSNAQNITGDVVVEYKMTDDGRYRFKAFRENQFEGLIDGMLYKTGIGVVYSRDYNSFNELLSKPSKQDSIQ